MPRSAERPGPGRTRLVLFCLAASVALGAAAALGGVVATRLAAARSRNHRRRAREVLDERSGDRGYPWP
ncbi:hypothetical protein ABH920_005186 [Catenulispora sp. EB89]|uniref:hypothetical protein n=1 Tax=Catenulispora sp. EB89 TaxID=3156257 RepID=UPI003516F215